MYSSCSRRPLHIFFQHSPCPIQSAAVKWRSVEFDSELIVILQLRNQDAFELHFLQLKSYCTDTRELIPPSELEYPMSGLNLLRLLVQNRFAEFHAELELLPPVIIRV